MCRMRFETIGIARHRLATDGDGVTTLVGGYGCPLDCRWCLNPQCHGGKSSGYAVESLYDKLKCDSLYFEATGGGVTFGGGEPLLQIGFICDFIDYVRSLGLSWHFYIETSLAVKCDVAPLASRADRFIIDVKDMNPEIYFAYTGRSSDIMRENLMLLARLCPEKLRVRLPLIPDYNTPEDVARSADELMSLGITDLDRFMYKKTDKICDK